MSGRRSNRSGTFTRRGKGWMYRLQVDGQRITTTGRTQEEAKKRADERVKVLGDQRNRLTVADLVDEWADTPAVDVGLRATTRDQYVSLLRNHIVPVAGRYRLETMSKRDAATAVRKLEGSAATRRAAYAAWVKVMDYAVDAGLLSHNVVREVKRPRAGKARERGMSRDEARALLAQAHGHRWEVAAWLGLGLGLRRGEMLGLRWSDVDLERCVLTVNGNVTRSSAGLVRGEPKTQRGVRQMPIPGPVLDAIRAHRTRQTQERLRAGAAWSDYGLVLTNEIGGVIDPRNLSRVWRRWARAAGVKDTGSHAARHFAATELLASGAASVADVAAQMGHNPAVLLTTYASPAAAGQRAAAEALGAALVSTT